MAGDAGRDRHRVAAVQGVTVSADLPGIVEKIGFESGQTVRAGRRPRPARHAAGARAAGGRPGAADLARVNLERQKRLARDRDRGARRTSTRADAEFKQAEATVGEIAGDHRAQDDPRSVLRRPRHPAGQPRPVPGGRAPRSCRCRRSIPSTSTSPSPSRRSRGCEVGSEVSVTARGRAGPASGRSTAIDSVVDRGHAQRASPGDACQRRRQAAARHVRRGQRGPRHDRRRHHGPGLARSTTRPTATRFSSSTN